MPAELERSLSKADPAGPSAGSSVPDGAAPSQMDATQTRVGSASAPPPAGPVATGEPIQRQPLTAEPPARAAAPAPSAAPPGRPSGSARPSMATELGWRLRELTWLAAGVVDLFLALDFGFRAVGAPPDGFVSVVTRIGDALASPFSGIIRGNAPRVGLTNSWPLVLALLVYTVAAWLLVRFLAVLLGSAPRRRA